MTGLREERHSRAGRRRGRALWACVGLLVACLGGLLGCKGYDEFSIKKMNFEVFHDPENPLEVIKTSTSGTARARAIGCLKEPLANGGTEEEQKLVVEVLNFEASHDSQSLCRIAAVDMLRTFRDPRAVNGVKEAYYRAGSFAPATATVIRCQALTALGEMGAAPALELLVSVLREPPSDGTSAEQAQKYNERITAARALGNFKQPQATGALLEVLRTEKENIALRNSAGDSLVKATGKELPPDATAWSEYLNSAEAKQPVPAPGVGQRLLQLTGLRQ